MANVLIGLALAQKLTSFRKRLVDLAGVFPGALRALRPSAPLPAYNGCDLLDQFVCLEFFS